MLREKRLVRQILIIVLIVSLVAGLCGMLISAAVARFSLVKVLMHIMPQHHLTSDINILVIGVDDAKDSFRSDTIMVVNLSPKTKNIGVISVPRDTRVLIPGHGLQKINHSYAFGGVDMVRKTVANFLQIPIPYWVELHMAGVSKIVDDLGGVDIDVDKRMYYVDKAGDLYIDINKGRQHLNGERAVQYIRYRKDVMGDITRISRQQNFIRALANQVVGAGIIFKAPKLMIQLTRYIKTNMSMRMMVTLAFKMKEAYEMGNIDVDTIPGSPALVDAISYWIPDLDQTKAMVNRVIYGFVEVTPQLIARKAQTRIEVLNGSRDKDKASRVAYVLQKQGYAIAWIGNGPHLYEKTLIVNWKGMRNNSNGTIIAHEISIPSNRLVIYDRPQKPIDFTVVVGEDLKL